MAEHNKVSGSKSSQRQRLQKLKQFKENITEEMLKAGAPSPGWGEFSMLDDPENWETAFPLAGYQPALEPPTEEDNKLAETFCPKLYVDPRLIDAERKFLKQNLTNEEIAEALFLFHIGHFPEDFPDGASRAAAELRLLAPTMSGVQKKGFEEIIRREFEAISLKRRKEYVDELFERILPLGSPTCVIKYRVVPSSQDSNIWCIQYFTYWPIQLGFWPPRRPLRWGLRHPFDYEPCFIFVRRRGKIYKPLMMVFNASASISPRHVRFFKRFGHIIRTLIDWDAEDLTISPFQFNAMAKSMTKAYGGQYLYQTLDSWGETHINQFVRTQQSPQLKIAKRWHSYDSCTEKDKEKLTLLECSLHPLKSQDLLHIEWDIRNPFQAPFLYPTSSRKKDPLLHLPFDVQIIVNYKRFTGWNTYAYKKPTPGRKLRTLISLEYQNAIFAGLLYEVLQGKQTPWEIWRWRIDMKVGYETYIAEALGDLRNKFLYEYTTELKDATRRKPRDAVAWRIRGLDHYTISGAFGKIESAPESIKVPMKHYSEAAAMDCFEKAIQLDDKCALSYYYRAVLFRAKGKITKALQDCTTAIGLDRFERFAFNERGKLYLDLKEYSRALDDFKMVIDLDPTDQSGYVGLGEVYLAQGDSDKAIKEFERATNADSNGQSGYLGLADAYLAQRDMVKAKKALRRAVKADPSNSRACFQRFRLSMEKYHVPDFEEGRKRHAAVLDELRNKKKPREK